MRGENINNMWKKVFILLSAYLSAIAFAVIGGIVWYKNEENEEIKKTTKLALIITLIFSGISAIFSIYNYVGSLWSHYYSTGAYEFYKVINTFVNIAKIIVFAVLIIREIIKETKSKKILSNEKNQNDSKNIN